MTYYAGYAMHADPKRRKPIDQFWSIDVDKESITEDTKERMRKVLEKARAKWSN